MDRRFLTVLGVSLLFALVISSVFYQMTSRAGGPKKEERTDVRDIVLAAKPMGVGTTVKPADVKLGKTPVCGADIRTRGASCQRFEGPRPTVDAVSALSPTFNLASSAPGAIEPCRFQGWPARHLSKPWGPPTLTPA